MKRLLADREFIGDKWMGWLIEENIPFNIRIRNNSYSVNSQGARLSVGQLLIVANASFDPNVIEEYGFCWEIETLFGC